MIQVFSDLQVVAEIPVSAGLLMAVRKTDPQWVILTLTPRGQLPKVVEPLLTEYPFLGIIALATDGSRALMRWMEHQEILEDISLNKLISILRRRSMWEPLVFRNGKVGLH